MGSLRKNSAAAERPGASGLAVGHEPEPLALDTLCAELTDACSALGASPRPPGQRVPERLAAELLGLGWSTLRHLRYEARGPRWIRAGCGRGCSISYSLSDIAAWIVEQRSA